MFHNFFKVCMLICLHIDFHWEMSMLLKWLKIARIQGIHNCNRLMSHQSGIFVCFFNHSEYSAWMIKFISCSVLIETLSADRATLLQEKKKLDEEFSRLRSNVLVCSGFSSTGLSGAEASTISGTDVPCDSERLATLTTVGDDGRVDSAMEASTMTVQ